MLHTLTHNEGTVLPRFFLEEIGIKLWRPDFVTFQMFQLQKEFTIFQSQVVYFLILSLHDLSKVLQIFDLILPINLRLAVLFL